MKQIVLIDDDEDLTEVLEDLFEQEGMAVEKFHTARGALAFIETSTPDLILLDVSLPDMSGLELLDLLKKSDKYSRIPVILMSADKLTESPSHHKQVTFIQKPFQFDTLTMAITNFIRGAA